MSKQTIWHLSVLLAVWCSFASAPVRAQLTDAQVVGSEDAGALLPPLGLDSSTGVPSLDASVIVDAAAQLADASRGDGGASDAGAKDAGPPAPTSQDLQLPDQGCSLAGGPRGSATASLLLALALLCSRARARASTLARRRRA